MRVGKVLGLATITCLAGCGRGEPPAPDGSPSVAAPELPAPSAQASASAVASASSAPSAALP